MLYGEASFKQEPNRAMLVRIMNGLLAQPKPANKVLEPHLAALLTYGQVIMLEQNKVTIWSYDDEGNYCLAAGANRQIDKVRL
jgi:hypothetical protein